MKQHTKARRVAKWGAISSAMRRLDRSLGALEAQDPTTKAEQQVENLLSYARRNPHLVKKTGVGKPLQFPLN